MKANKCKKCGLVNSLSDIECRRCRHILLGDRHEDVVSTRQKASRFSLAPLLAVVAIVGAGYFLYNGVKKADNEIMANQANSQPANQPAPLSRSEYQQQQKGQYFNAIQNSNGLNQAKSHTDEIDKLTQHGSNANAK